MSLLVYAYIRETDGSIKDIEEKPEAPYNDLAGFEGCRNKLWGSKIVKQIGCKILPQFSGNDVYAENNNLKSLENDCHLILNSIKEVSTKTDYDEKFIELRVQNILHAIKIAKKYAKGGVCIS